jgi:NAD(P)-dependent dehydrogenase (short-subunit alcohol dehydrogenase family)
MRLQDRVAIVTGGARGIGAGIARALAAEGAKVAVVDLDEEQARATAAALGTDAMALRADLAEQAEVDALVGAVIGRFGRLDIMVNNAGAGRAPVDESTENYGTKATKLDQRDWDEQLAQNLRTTFLGTRAATPHLQHAGGGAIVNIASIAGLVASPTLPAYAAAKAGVISFTRTTALDLAPANIRVNAICPGLLWTRAWEGLATGMKQRVPGFEDREIRDIFLDVVKRSVPLGREQTPDDIGKLAAFLCSDDAQNITGQAISVDGGITLRGG